jgi:hypothetical protein
MLVAGQRGWSHSFCSSTRVGADVASARAVLPYQLVTVRSTPADSSALTMSV